MGQQQVKEEFTPEDFAEFSRRLNIQVDILRDAIRQPGFGSGPLKLGAELEMYLVGSDFNVSPNNLMLLEALKDPQFTPEINKYNIEYNMRALDIKGRPFSEMLREMRAKTAELEACAYDYGIHVVPVGILPTIRRQDFGSHMMTDAPRYHALGKRLRAIRGEPFKIHIDGTEPFSFTADDVTMEGANTSFQVHMMVDHKKFASTFNAAQLTLPLVLASCANSGVFMGNMAWDETRVVLFKQSLDTRIHERTKYHQPARVSFGYGWCRRDAWELYTETVAIYDPIMPMLSDENAEAVWDGGFGKLPHLKELAAHMGTTWPWHRPVYSNEGDGHVRIEFRALPAGPTSLDMVANAAFSMGLAAGMADRIEEYLAVMPFRYAEYNFYRAAKYGLDANILWPYENRHYLSETPIIKVLERLMPFAKKGLEKIGVEAADIDLFLNVITNRIESGVTGARWQKHTLRHFEQTMPRDEANREMIKLYTANARTGAPVSEWERLW